MKKRIYILSGLGADERVFQLLDFSDFAPVFIKWIIPEENESIENYANRLLAQIDTPNPLILGLSFGGMMATEIAKLMTVEKIILISSAKTNREIPFYYQLSGFLGIHKLIPTKVLKSSNVFTNWFFGANSTFEKQLLKEILHDTNPVFLKWAIHQIVDWKNIVSSENTYHIHGTADRILPINGVSCDVKIKGGGHLMTLTKPEEINEILKKIL